MYKGNPFLPEEFVVVVDHLEVADISKAINPMILTSKNLTVPLKVLR